MKQRSGAERLVEDLRVRVCPDEVDQTGRVGGQNVDLAG